MSADPKDPGFPTAVEPVRLGAEALGPIEPFIEAYRRYYPGLRKWLRHKASAEAVEHILAQILDKLLTQRPGAVTNLRAYLRKMAKNLLANYHRDEQLHRNKERVFLAPELEEDVPSPESALLREQRLQLLKKVMEGLPRHHRTALQLHVYEDLSAREIAARFAELGVTVSERTATRYIDRAWAACESALRASEEPKEEWDK